MLDARRPHFLVGFNPFMNSEKLVSIGSHCHQLHNLLVHSCLLNFSFLFLYIMLELFFHPVLSLLLFLLHLGQLLQMGKKGLNKNVLFGSKQQTFSVTIRTIHWLIMLFLEQSNKLQCTQNMFFDQSNKLQCNYKDYSLAKNVVF